MRMNFFQHQGLSRLTDCHFKRLNSNPYGSQPLRLKGCSVFQQGEAQMQQDDRVHITSPLSCLHPSPCNPRSLLPLHQRDWISHEPLPNNPTSWSILPRVSWEHIHAPGNGRCWLGNDFFKTQGIVLIKISFKNMRLYSKGNPSPQRNSLQLTLRTPDGCANYPFLKLFFT